MACSAIPPWHTCIRPIDNGLSNLERAKEITLRAWLARFVAFCCFRIHAGLAQPVELVTIF